MKKILLIYVLLGVLFVSCGDLDDNIDPKAPAQVPPSTLFTNSLVKLAVQVDESSVNLNTIRLIAQYWQSTTYFEESRYDFQERTIPDNFFEELYRDMLRDAVEAERILNSFDYTGSLAVVRDNQIAILKILETYAFQVLVDAFGDIPFSEALKGAENSTPKYDDDQEIYVSLIDDLNAALNTIDVSAEGFGSTADVLFADDMEQWRKFGYSLLLRLGVRISDAMPEKANTVVSSAISGGVFEQGEMAEFKFTGVVPYVNTIYDAFIVDNRTDWLPCNTIIDKMKELSDNRIGQWFTQVDGEYVGAVAGLDEVQSYNSFSHFAPRFFEADLPVVLLDYMEVEFLLAEAAARGLGGVTDANVHYENAIRASFDYWSAEGADEYLAQDAVAFSADNWKELIGTQKWIALYNRAVEAWAEWRRLDYPILNTPVGLTYDDIPRRMPYPYDENDLNPDNYAAAASAIGGDNVRTKVFWDVE